MKKFILIPIFFLSSLVAFGQSSPVKWTFSAKQIADKTYELRYSAKVNDPWHIYSQTTPEGGPLPTKISLFRNPLLMIQGSAWEIGKMQTKHEDVFDIDVKYYEGQVDFVQVIKLKNKAKTKAVGSIEFMLCKDEQCLPPTTVEFNIPIE